MVKVTFTNNAGTRERIVDETKAIYEILEEAEFSYDGAAVVVNGRSGVALDSPLVAFLGEGATTARITAVAHKANA